MAEKPLSQRRSSGPSKGCLIPFFGLFLAAGLAFTWFLLVKPVAGILAARSWSEATCVVQASRVEEVSDSDGTTYKPVIDYTYTFNGGEYRSSRYRFVEFSSSGYQGKAEVVARYPPGRRTPCYVNPENPSEAVLSRDFDLAYLIGLFPLLFVAAGVGGILFTLRGGFRSARSRAQEAAASSPAAASFGIVAPETLAGGGPVELKSGASPVAKFVGILFIALFWNGIVSVFLYQVVEGWRTGAGDGCLTAFLVPFVLVGLALIYGIFQQFLVLFVPRPRLTLSRGALLPGEPVQVQWRFSGSAGRIQKLRIVLEGSELVRYRRGTDVHTATEVFFSEALAEVQHASQIPAGTARLEVPAGSMPSFEADNNKILWKLKVVCEVPNWPDNEEEYPLVVLPPSRMGALGGGLE
ncbi:MAG TPA: DUF3592 domain-containing protein [Thermoanaerobaculia bacterium]|nr:DUF3592 domain-containing protein [Thermoanaerobaculia bacterium]